MVRIAARRGDPTGGQATPIGAVLVLCAGLCVVGLAGMGQRATERARVDAAADAAALAGTLHGRQAAVAAARANGATVVEFRRVGDDVVVRVRVGSQQASARARALPG